MPSAADLKTYLLPYIGKNSGSTINATDSAHLMRAANAALLELLGDGTRRAELRRQLVRAPASVTLDNVTANSKTITFTGFDATMLGCSIQIGSTWNRLVKPASTVELEAEYSGDTASSVAATVYYDAIPLDYAIESPLEPVMLNDLYPVTLLPNRSSLEASRLARAQAGLLPQGVPLYAVIEDSLSALATPATRFLFDSLPQQSYSLSFKAVLRPPQIGDWSDATPFFLPGGRDVEILHPVARFHLSSYPVFIGERGEALDDYKIAKAKWDAFTNKGSQPGQLSLYAC